MLSVRCGRVRGQNTDAQASAAAQEPVQPMLVGELILPYQPTGRFAACSCRLPANALSADSAE